MSGCDRQELQKRLILCRSEAQMIDDIKTRKTLSHILHLLDDALVYIDGVDDRVVEVADDLAEMETPAGV